MAADSGGVLPWTQWAIAVASVGVLLMSVPFCFTEHRLASFRPFALSICLLALGGFSVLQTIAFPSSLLSLVAPGSTQTYESMVDVLELAPAGATDVAQWPGWFPITVSTWLTKTAAAQLITLAAFATAASMAFHGRRQVGLLLYLLAITGAVQATFGFIQMANDGSSTVWGIRSYLGGAPFGSYVNRSSAAVLMNIGLGASVGLLAWRLAALTGASFDSDEFTTSELLDVLFDRAAIVGLVCGLLNAAGLLACGSRGGLVGAIAGFALAFGIVQSLHRGRGMMTVLAVIGLMAAILLVKIDLPALSVDRLQDTPDVVMQPSGIHDGRLDHWHDGWSTAIAQPLVGWGNGAYRFAYLPYQDRSAGAWFVNADNLWLEWFVELGIVGVLLALAAIVVIVRSVQRLNASPDPVDHGLATAGWFTIGAMAVSQFFDFGLRIPANALAATMIASVVVARCFLTGSAIDLTSTNLTGSTKPNPPKIQSALFRGREYLPGVVMAGICIVAMLPAVAFLRDDAAADHLRRLAKFMPTGAQFNPDVADRLQTELQTHLAAHPDDYMAQIEISKLIVESARYRIATEGKTNRSPDEWLENYRLSSPSALRSAWYQSHDQGSPETIPEPLFSADLELDNIVDSTASDAAERLKQLNDERRFFATQLAAARRHTQWSLTHCPLSDEAATSLITLDMAGGSPAQSDQLLDHYRSLRRNYARSLMYAGNLAYEAQRWDMAKDIWLECMSQDPYMTSYILAGIKKDSPIPISELLPDNPIAVSIVAQQEIMKTAPNTAMLSRAVSTLQRNLPEDRDERIKRQTLIARIQMKREQFEQAAQTYASIILLAPTDLDARYQYAVSLRKSGNIVKARQEARNGQKINPSDPRFEQLLASMSGGT